MTQTESQSNWEQTVEWVGVVAGCLIKRDSKYLLVQEKQAKVYGLWNLPAGYVDKGETIEAAAIREAKEEIGLYHEDVGTPVKHVFRAEITGGKLTVQEDEILDAKWLTLEEIRTLEETRKLRVPWIWSVLCRAERILG